MKHLQHLTMALFLSALAMVTIASGASAQVVHSLPKDATAYQLTIQGNIDQVISFTLSGRLVAVPTLSPGSSHPFDLCLDMGDQGKPLTNPEAGDITLDTNAACNSAFVTPVDMGSLTFDSSTGIATVQVDPNASTLNVNMFDVSSGVAGGAEEVVAGTVQLQFTTPDNGQTIDVNGQINVQGNASPFNPEQNDTYTATVSGSTS